MPRAVIGRIIDGESFVPFEAYRKLDQDHDEALERLRLANEIIDELTEVAEVHLDDTFEKILKLRQS